MPPPRGLLCHLITPNGVISGGEHVQARTLAALPHLGGQNVGDEQTLAHARAKNGGRLASGLDHGEMRADECAVEYLTLCEHARELLSIVDVGEVSLGNRGDALLRDARQHLIEDGTLRIGQVGVALALLDSGENGLASNGGGGHGGTPLCPRRVAAPCCFACPPWTITNIAGYNAGSSRNSKFAGIVKCLVDRGAARGFN